jgi:hypothetical protein
MRQWNSRDSSPPRKKKTYGRLAAARCTHDAIDEKQGQSRCKRRRVNEGAQNLRDCYFRRVKTLDVHSPSYGEIQESAGRQVDAAKKHETIFISNVYVLAGAFTASPVALLPGKPQSILVERCRERLPSSSRQNGYYMDTTAWVVPHTPIACAHGEAKTYRCQLVSCA